MVIACSVCGLPLPPGARFCPNCGAAVGALVETEERKVVTIVFADIVDSTRLAQTLDPERSRELLGSFFDAANEELAALRGRAEKYVGDAVMAVFGLPHVHEDDAVRAVRAGLAIRARAHRLGASAGVGSLEVRVGIETGEAAVGRGPTGQLLVTGPVVNAAARLQSAARAGEVLAGRTTQALTANKVSFGRRRRIRAKGFDEALDAHPVDGLTTRSARRTIPFVGRTSEQAILGQSLGLASTTGRPVLVTVAGEAGIGKSRLADELAAGVSAAVPILRGRTRSDTDTATFSAAATIVADLAGIEGSDSPERIRARLQELVERCCDPAESPRVTQRLGLLFGLAEQPEETAFVHDVQAGFIALIDGLARDHPVVLLFDDVHDLKAPMLDLIERLAGPGRRGPRRALVVALARDELLEQRPTWGSSSGNAVLVRLDPLSQEDAVHLARHAAGGHIEDAEAQEIARRAGGNPFFIIETTGMLMPDGNGSAPRRATLPPTVQAIVAARLDTLPARLRDLARRAAIFKYSFDLEELAVVDAAATEAELLQLEDAEVIVRDQPSMGAAAPQWKLRHATLKEVAYASLPKRERLRLHQRVAEFLLQDGHLSLAADHLELAALAALDLDPDDRTVAGQAADALLRAGDRARRRMELRSAVERYQRALVMGGDETKWGMREARALAGMGEAYYWLGEYPAAIEALERGATLGEAHDDAFTLALALRFLGDVAINYEANVDKAEALLNRSLEAAEKLGDPWAVVRTLLFAGWVPWTRGRFEESERMWRRALEMVDPKDTWARVRALTALSINRSDMGDAEAALKLIDEANALAEEAGDQFSVANTQVQKGRALDELGRHDEALPWFDRGIAIFAELGARWELADARAARGIAMRELGRLDAAEEDLRFAIRTAEDLGDRQLPAWTWRNLARVAELRGDKAEAEELLRRSREAELRGPR